MFTTADYLLLFYYKYSRKKKFSSQDLAVWLKLDILLYHIRNDSQQRHSIITEKIESGIVMVQYTHNK